MLLECAWQQHTTLCTIIPYEMICNTSIAINVTKCSKIIIN